MRFVKLVTGLYTALSPSGTDGSTSLVPRRPYKGPIHKSFAGVLLASCLVLVVFCATCRSQDVSGNYYPWQQTLKPEKPWVHDYSQTLVMKVNLCSRDENGNVKVHLTFSDALEVIKKLDRLTLGVPKIIYLVGWQFSGHDSGYPSWSVVNGSLKRPVDKSALQSLKWLMRQARLYHTTVSLHINMIDAYKSSPLWQVYDENNIIIKDKSGIPIKGEVFSGWQSYQISYAQEWRLGFTQKRIDGLLQMLPELKQAGTIHVDAFHSIQPARSDDPLSNPYLGLTIDDEIATQRKIFRYWRMKGLDVTAESDIYSLRKDPFIGLQPFAWWYVPDNFTKMKWLNKPAGFKGLPPSLYTGTPMHAEMEILKDPVNLSGLVSQFCTEVVPWYYRNNTLPKHDNFSAENERENVFLPALWLRSTVVACSDKGYVSRILPLPESWGQVQSVKVMQVTIDGLKGQTVVPVKHHTVKLTLKAGEVIAIQG